MALPILCFHKVGSESEEGRFLCVSPRRLQQFVLFFRRRGFQFVRVCDLANSWPARGVCLTFDDAYVSACVAGVEVLLQAEAPATFYAVSSLVGAKSAWDGNRARPLADWPTLQSLHAAGFEIGSHTSTHPDLSALSQAAQQDEWAQAALALREHGMEPLSACFPYGRSSPQSAAALQAAGISLCVGLKRRLAVPADDRLDLPRIPVAYSDTLPVLLYRLYLRPKMRSKR